mgnify:CR=1 FL=1
MSKPSPRHAAPVAARRGLAGAGALSLALAGGAFAVLALIARFATPWSAGTEGGRS